MVNYKEKKSLNNFFLLVNYVKDLVIKCFIFTEHLKQAAFHTQVILTNVL